MSTNIIIPLSLISDHASLSQKSLLIIFIEEFLFTVFFKSNKQSIDISPLFSTPPPTSITLNFLFIVSEILHIQIFF